jgi:phage-related protein
MKRAVRGEVLSREEEHLTDSGGLRALRVFIGNDPYRVIFVAQSRRAWLALRAVYKNQARLPHSEILLAQRRLEDWRTRGQAIRKRSTGGTGT